MEKTIVIYQSSTGFTKQYAEWIAQKVGCKAVSMKEVSENDISQYERVVFGGWIMANMISGLDKMRKLNPEKLVVFAVGSTPAWEEVEEEIKNQNHLEDTPFFYMESGFHFDQIKFPLKMMLKMMKKMVAKKENRTRQDEYMLKMLGTNFDNSDIKYIEPLCEYLSK